MNSHTKNEGIAFNLKRFEYEGGTQIRIYGKTLKHGSIQDEKKSRKNTNETIEKKNEVLHEENEEKDIEETRNKSQTESRNRTIQSIYGIARSNKWDLFLTITFNPDLVDSTNYEEVVKKTNNWLRNLKKRIAPNMKYLLIPELHADKKKWHFHGLLADCPELTLIETDVVRNGKRVYNLGNWKYGFTEVTYVEDSRRVSAYISKYITKEVCDVTFGKKRYWASKNCIRPEEVMSVDYVESIQDYIRSIADDIKHIKKLTSHGQEIYYIEV